MLWAFAPRGKLAMRESNHILNRCATRSLSQGWRPDLAVQPPGSFPGSVRTEAEFSGFEESNKRPVLLGPVCCLGFLLARLLSRQGFRILATGRFLRRYCLPLLKGLIRTSGMRHMSLFCFDAAGCGQSEGRAELATNTPYEWVINAYWNVSYLPPPFNEDYIFTSLLKLCQVHGLTQIAPHP